MKSTDLTRKGSAVYCRGERFRLYLSDETIQNRVDELGAEISREAGLQPGPRRHFATCTDAGHVECDVLLTTGNVDRADRHRTIVTGQAKL